MRLRLIRCLFLGLAAASGVASAVALAADEIEKIDKVPYAVRGKTELLADVFMPKGPGPFPAVLCVHGGAWSTGKRTYHMDLVASKLAEQGYTAVSIDYRLAPQFQFPAQIEDCRAAARWMRDNADRYKIDPLRIGGYGYSAGAHLVTLLGTTDASYRVAGEAESKTSARLQAVVAGGAPCEFRILPADNPRLAFWLGGSRAEKPEAYELASPLKYVSADDPPMFFFHGQNDSLVPLASPEAMVKALTAAGVRSSLYVVPNASHVEAAYDAKAFADSLQFLDQVLKPDKPAAKGTAAKAAAEPEPAAR